MRSGWVAIGNDTSAGETTDRATERAGSQLDSAPGSERQRAALAPSTGPSPTAARWHALDLALLACAAGSLGASCLLMSPNKYFWCDELFSWTLVTDRSLRHMIAALAQSADGAPPLFHVTARLWSSAFGTGEAALRSLSCFGFIVAMGVMWAMVRRAYGRWPAAIASVAVFATSQLVLYQIAEARFYGLLTALVACAVYLYTRAIWTGSHSWRLFASTALVHAGLLYTHVYGALYSAAILAAWIVADRLQRRRWYAGYLSVLVGWLAFVPWLPAFQRIAATGKPHSWLSMPAWPSLVTTYSFTLWYLPAVVTAVVCLGIVDRRAPTARLADPVSPPVPRSLPVQWLARLSAFLFSSWIAKVAAGSLVLAAALIYVPRGHLTVTALRDAWTYDNSTAVLALLVIVAVQQVVSSWRHTRSRVGPRPPAVIKDESLLIVGYALLGVPLVAFGVSQLGTSIFLDRYFIPASLGVVPVLGHFIWWCIGRPVDVRDRRWTPRHLLTAAGWSALFVLVAAQPAWVNRNLRPQPRPGTEVESLAPAGATVVVESELDLLPVRHYQQRRDITYVVPLDWAAATDPHSYLGATVEYHLLDIWRQVGYLDPVTASGTQVPCTGRPFVVLHSWRHSWFNDRIAGDSAFEVQSLGQSWSTLEKSGIILVRPRPSIVPAVCRGAATVSLAAPMAVSTVVRSRRG